MEKLVSFILKTLKNRYPELWRSINGRSEPEPLYELEATASQSIHPQWYDTDRRFINDETGEGNNEGLTRSPGENVSGTGKDNK